MFFEVKITYPKTHENGLVKKATEAYIVNAETFTEAEIKMNEYASLFGMHDFCIKTIRIVNYVEIFHKNDGDTFFEAKIRIVTLDENRGYEKFSEQRILIIASDIEDAKNVLKSGMNGTLIDWHLIGISESKYCDIIDKNNEYNVN